MLRLFPLIPAPLTFPIAKRPLSKRRQTPRNRKATPNPARPTPISEKMQNNCPQTTVNYYYFNLQVPNYWTRAAFIDKRKTATTRLILKIQD